MQQSHPQRNHHLAILLKGDVVCGTVQQLTGVHGSTEWVRLLRNHVALKLRETRWSRLSCIYRQDAGLDWRERGGGRLGVQHSDRYLIAVQ